MTVANIARLFLQASAFNAVNVPTVQIRFQRAPGTSGERLGIPGLEYEVQVDGNKVTRGTTKTDGQVLVPTPPGKIPILKILGSDYPIHRLLNFAPTKSTRGMQQRLSQLGYYAGPLAANEAVTTNLDLYNFPDVATEQAVLDFQADEDLFADALCGPKTQKALEDAVKTAGDIETKTPSDYEARKGTIGAHARLKKLVHRTLRVVPVRFARAPVDNDPTKDSGPPNSQAPDPDDRGFAGCLKSKLRGSVLPVAFDEALPTQAETRIRLLRTDIADAADLFIAVDDPKVLQITSPVQNPGPNAKHKLESKEKVQIKFRALKAGSCFMEVHFGAQDGPVIHRMQVVVNKVVTLQVKAHAPVINGAAYNAAAGAVPTQSTFNTLAKIQARFDEVNHIYLPYGIKFEVINTVDTDPVNFRFRGSVDLTDRIIGGVLVSEFNTMVQQNREGHGAINVIFVPQIVEANLNWTTWETAPDRIGGCASSAIGNPASFGLLLADWAREAQTVAHEIGHILNLVNDPPGSGDAKNLDFVHVNARDFRDPAKTVNPGTGVNVRDDIISRRRLMWAYTEILDQTLREFPAIAKPLAASNYEAIMAYRKNVGYGDNKVGTMLAIKSFAADRTDGEMAEVQKSAKVLIAKAGP